MLRNRKQFLLVSAAFCILGSQVFGQGLISQGGSNDLAEHLWQVLKDTIGNTPITGDAEGACRRLINEGAPKVTDKAAAERDIKRFARELVKQASVNEAGGKEIDLPAYNRAYNSICPLYPFC